MVNISLEEIKNYLRVDTTEDDELISSLLTTSKKLCLDIIRIDSFNELSSENNYEDLKIPILYGVSYLYQNREEADFNKLNLTLRALLFGVRKEGF